MKTWWRLYIRRPMNSVEQVILFGTKDDLFLFIGWLHCTSLVHIEDIRYMELRTGRRLFKKGEVEYRIRHPENGKWSICTVRDLKKLEIECKSACEKLL